jgi:hypothetical protein
MDESIEVALVPRAFNGMPDWPMIFCQNREGKSGTSVYHSVVVSNAGARNFDYDTLARAYGPDKLDDVKFYIHK